MPCRRKSRSGGKGRGVGHAPRFTLTHAKKVRGAVSQCAQVMEHIIVSVANRVEVYSVEGKEMKQIATHHAPHYVVASQRPLTFRRRLDQTRSWVVAFAILSLWKTSGPSRRVREDAVASMASSRDHVTARPSP